MEFSLWVGEPLWKEEEEERPSWGRMERVQEKEDTQIQPNMDSESFQVEERKQQKIVWEKKSGWKGEEKMMDETVKKWEEREWEAGTSLQSWVIERSESWHNRNFLRNVYNAAENTTKQ